MFDGLLSRFGYEKRSSYEAAITAALLSRSEGIPAPASATGALEACAGAVGRSFASARISGQRSEVLSPSVMMLIGRNLILSGESVLVIEGSPELRLVPVSAYSIMGSYDPRSWVYEVTLNGPSLSIIRQIEGEDIVHVRINADPSKPWAGTSPSDNAHLISSLASKSAKALEEEVSGPHGNFIPAPQADHSELKSDIKNARGDALLVESMAGNWDGGGVAPKGDWSSNRFGFDAPESMVETAKWSSDQLMAAAGISAALFAARDAASSVASYRHFVHSVIGPLARITQAELSRKLESDITLDFSDLRAADVQARAGSLKKMVESGLPVEKALALSGLLAQDAN